MNYIEELLFEKTKDFQEGQIYSDQWKFAKSYLPKVLDTISHVFPHYSLHNSTHSEAIINNIIRIVGRSSIQKLSVVDLWLLLAAAYYHDCGMIVTGKDKAELFKAGSDFVKFVEEKQQDTASPMNQYALLFDIKEEKIFFKNETLTQDSYEGARYLLADYIRNEHAERSGSRIDKEESLHFPGDPIPERIIRILKSICSCHTKNIDEVMKLQPVESSGCGIEDCHPRFVAAMLRLGDLLDVDSNRVSEVLLSTLGSIPSDSKFYNKTNRSITHIRIDHSVIEITAECDDYRIADLINRWFQWLNDELVYYMKRWHMIIPCEGFGYLPTVGDLKVNLSHYDTFDGKKRPSFEIDSSRAIELLQGAGLYTDSCECIRELLQNAVDATYLRVYKENPGINNLKKFKERCENYPITVDLKKVNKTETKDKDVYWQISITDRGIGMTKEDLSFLSKTGSSGRNAEKKKLIQSVPEFLWPSGNFGIGFQSVFLITDYVNVITRKINKDYYVKAQMHNPSGKEKGAILIQSVNKEDVDYGTTLSFEFKDKKESHQLINYDDRYSVSEFNSFDFAKNKNVNLLGMKVMDEVIRFANGTFIPVEFSLEGEKKKFFSNKTRIEFGDIDDETGLQLFMDKTISLSGYITDSKVYFRNQWVRDYNPYIPFLTFHINILKGSAKNLLTLNRNRIRSEQEPALNDDIKKTIIKFLNKKIESFDMSRKQLAAMFIENYRDFILEKNITDIRERDYWKKYELSLKKENSDQNKNFSLEKLLTANSIEHIKRFAEADKLIFDFGAEKYTISIEYDELVGCVCEFLQNMAQKQGYHLLFKKGGFVLNRKNCDIIDDTHETREDIMYNYLKKEERARGAFPCGSKYAILEVDSIIFPKYIYEDYYYLNYPRMICPYIRKYDIEHPDEAICLEYDIDNKVLNTVYENRRNKNITKEQIKDAYNEFKKEWGPVVDKVNQRVKKESANSFGWHRYRIVT